MATYIATYSSGAKLTSIGNDVITFSGNIQYLSFQTFGSPCSIKINGEATIHWIDSNSEFVLSDIYIGKITIIDSGVQYYYTALSLD